MGRGNETTTNNEQITDNIQNVIYFAKVHKQHLYYQAEVMKQQRTANR